MQGLWPRWRIQSPFQRRRYIELLMVCSLHLPRHLLRRQHTSNLPQHMVNLQQHMVNLQYQLMDNLQHQLMDNLQHQHMANLQHQLMDSHQLPMDNCRLVLLSMPLQLPHLRLQSPLLVSILHLLQVNISPLQRPTRPLLLIKPIRILGSNLSNPNLLHFSRRCPTTTSLQEMVHRALTNLLELMWTLRFPRHPQDHPHHLALFRQYQLSLRIQLNPSHQREHHFLIPARFPSHRQYMVTGLQNRLLRLLLLAQVRARLPFPPTNPSHLQVYRVCLPGLFQLFP